MFQHTVKLTIGSGDATDLIQSIETDLAPQIEAADGFIAYTAVKIDDQTVITTRLFRDVSSIQAESQSSQQTTDQLINDFQLTVDSIINSDLNIGIASVLTEVFQP